MTTASLREDSEQELLKDDARDGHYGAGAVPENSMNVLRRGVLEFCVNMLVLFTVIIVVDVFNMHL